MKKFASFGLTALLLLQLFLPCTAAGTGPIVTDESDTIVQLSTVGIAEWKLSFPADMQIPWEADCYDIGEVKALQMHVAPNKAVFVQVTSANAFHLIHETERTEKIAYTLLANDSTALRFSFGPGDMGKAVPLTVKISEKDWAHASSGRHSDNLTFAVSYEDVTP